MLRSSSGSGIPNPPPLARPVEFYVIELMPLSDGHLRIGISATVCEPLPGNDFEFVNLDVASERVRNVEEAFAVIRQSIAVQ